MEIWLWVIQVKEIIIVNKMGSVYKKQQQLTGHCSSGQDLVVSFKDKYPNFEVGVKCILMVLSYLLLCSYINENAI